MKKLTHNSSLSLVASALALSLIFTGCGETDPNNKGNHKPDVNIVQNNKTVNVGTKVDLTSTALDVDGDALTYEWKFVSKPTDSSATLTTTTTRKASFTADKAGKYVVQFVAKDVVDAIGKDTVTITAKAGCISSVDVDTDITKDTVFDGDKCYNITRGILTISNDALLTIKPGATLIFEDNGGINVSDEGALKAVGTAEKPILFTGKQKVAGYWRSIAFRGSNNTKNEIDHAIVEYAGAGYGYGSVHLVGNYGSDNRLKLSNTTFKHSASHGFCLEERSKMDKFENITSTKNEKTAGFIHITNADQLDSQSNFTGNLGGDYVTVGTSGGQIIEDKTWKALSVPYNVTGGFSIDKDATLTIEAGASIVFDSRTYITVYGGLKAKGTALKPILFTGKGEIAGYWNGLEFSETNNADNVLDYVTVEYGGNNGHGGLFIDSYNATSYTRISVTNSTFKDNANAGIYMSYDEYAKYNKDIDKVNTFINNESGTVVRGN